MKSTFCHFKSLKVIKIKNEITDRIKISLITTLFQNKTKLKRNRKL